MKNKLLPLFVVLGGFSAYSQVGIGTKNPSPSAQLEVQAEKKGILIPRVELQSSTDVGTIPHDSNALDGIYHESLLVYNLNTIADIKPGYYYWFSNKWNRLAISGEAGSGTTAGVAGGAGVPGINGVTAPG
ncbi:MAG: hypothetical protein ABI892_02095 [Flavobacterium sp.]